MIQIKATQEDHFLCLVLQFIEFNSIFSFNIAHYDSDKSYEGRSFFMSSIASKMTKDSIILMDDIQDNPFFMDYVLSHNIEDWSIFKFEGKYIGMIGSIE